MTFAVGVVVGVLLTLGTFAMATRPDGRVNRDDLIWGAVVSIVVLLYFALNL
jgi:hypothetical protein